MISSTSDPTQLSALSIPSPLPPAHDSTASSATPQVLRCTDTADFLAALPHLSGFRAENCLTIVLFTQHRARSALRLDLPAPCTEASIDQLFATLDTLLKSFDSSETSPALVFNCQQPFVAEYPYPWRTLTARARDFFTRSSWQLQELAVVTADGWAPLLQASADEHPRSLAEITQSPVAAHAAEHCPPAPTLGSLSMLPAAHPARAAALTPLLRELSERTQRETQPELGCPEAQFWVLGLARAVAACFAADIPPHPRLLARLVHGCRNFDSWCIAALSAICTPHAVAKMSTEFARPAQPTNACPDMSRSGAACEDSGHMCETSDDSDVLRQHRVAALLAAAAAHRPNAKKLKQVIAVLGDAATHAPETHRAGLVGLLAWAWWVNGMSSVASNYLDQAAQLDANAPCLSVLRSLLEHPAGWLIPAWKTEQSA